jgi:hypothetical protein
MLFIAIHKHEYGQDVKLFNSGDDAVAIFYALPADQFDAEDADTDLTQVDFATRINVKYEPEKGETLDISLVPHETYQTLDFSDFMR